MPGLDLKGKETEWMQFFQMITLECPHCTIENLIVIDGAPFDYGRIWFSKVPPRDSVKPVVVFDDLNLDWEWFVEECHSLGTGIIPEAHFRDGNPRNLYGERKGKFGAVRTQEECQSEVRKVRTCT